MKLDNTFTIPVPAEDAWRVLLDIERIAPCVPGAMITSADGDNYQGTMKVKLGPVGLTYKGSLSFKSRDEAARIAVIEGGAREARGNGTAKATVTCRLAESAGGTDVFVETELDITGKPAQFGRGVFTEVAGALIGQFAANLAAEITASVGAATATADVAAAEPTAPAAVPASAAPAATVSTDTAATAAPAARKPAEPLDLLAAAGIGKWVGKWKWIGSAALAAAAVVLALVVFGRRRG
jgi:carbon monoxide dehydrogenase subunit G